MDVGTVSNFQVGRRTATRNESAAASASGPQADENSSGSNGVVFVSPAVKYDHTARMAVLLFRDPDTGDIKDQIPTESVLDAYRRSAGRKPEDVASAPVGASSDHAPPPRSEGAPSGGPMGTPAGGSFVPTPSTTSGGAGGRSGVSLTV